jgi:hypothetical protein
MCDCISQPALPLSEFPLLSRASFESAATWTFEAARASRAPLVEDGGILHVNFVKSPASYRWLAKHRKPIKHLKVVFSEGKTKEHVHVALAQFKDLLKWCPVGILEVVISQGAADQMMRGPARGRVGRPLDLSFLHQASPDDHPLRVVLDVAHVPYNRKSLRVLLPDHRVIESLCITCAGKLSLVGDCAIKKMVTVVPVGTPANRAAILWGKEGRAPVVECAKFHDNMMVIV